MHEEHPELVKDAYWDQHDFDIPYTEASQQHNIPPHLGSAMNIWYKIYVISDKSRL